MKFSEFGQKFTQDSGTVQLMEDLGTALSSGHERLFMLGGGNPARIPDVEARFRERMEAILAEAETFERLIGNYDAPQGNRELIDALARLLRGRFGWSVGPENIALTSGSQTSFFFLFNLLGGEDRGGRHRKVLLPLTPEYIGYADVGIEKDFFVASRPEIELIGDDLFKYHVDFDAVSVTEDVSAICVSRPTNPTSNVLTAEELERLATLAANHGVPLIIDNAYGTPFPNIIFTDAEPIWNENIILTMSLSKLGLPGTRTGIVIANEEVVSALTAMNAIVSLAPGSFGAVLAREMVRSGEILELSRHVIQPFYARKSEQALSWIREDFEGTPYRVHKPEGSFFFWLWLEGIPVSSQALYERLKERGVIVVPGHHFFPGLRDDWRHRQECLRVNYAQDERTVREGVRIIADEVRRAYARP